MGLETINAWSVETRNRNPFIMGDHTFHRDGRQMVDHKVCVRLNDLQYQNLQAILDYHGVGRIYQGNDISEKIRTLYTVLATKIPPELHPKLEEKLVDNVDKSTVDHSEVTVDHTPVESTVDHTNDLDPDDPELNTAQALKGIHNKFGKDNVTQKASPSRQALL